MLTGWQSVRYFTNYTYLHKTPFTIYVDFESLIVPIQSCSLGNDTAVAQKSHSGIPYYILISDADRQIVDQPESITFYEAMHVLSGFCYVIVGHEHNLV